MIALFFTVSIVEAASKHDHPSKYYAACREIDRADAGRVRDITRQMRLMYDNDLIHSIRCDLGLFRQQAEEKRECILQEFKNYYEISDDHWKGIRFKLFDIHNTKYKNRSQFCANIASDTNVPTSATFLIQKELVSRGINTSRVDLSSVISGSLVCDVMVGSKRDLIAINPNTWDQQSLQEKQWMSLYAVGAIEEELSLLPLLLKQCWHNIKPAKRKNFTGVLKLIEMTKIVNMYFLCLRSKEAAFLVKKYAHSIAISCFTVDDYRFISSVDWRWQVCCAVPHYVRPCWWLVKQKKILDASDQSSFEESHSSSHTDSTSEESESESGSGEQESSKLDDYVEMID